MAVPASAQQKPLSQDQVLGLVRNNLGDESGSKLIEQRGLDFQPSDEFLRALRRAGASEAFIKAVSAARFKPLSAPAATKPLNSFQLLAFLADEVPSQWVAMLVEERGINFKPGDAFLDALEMAGANQTLLQTLRGAQPVRARGPANTPAEEAAKAEQEFRTALKDEPEKPALHLLLGFALFQQQRLDEAMTEYQEALRLNPSFVATRIYLGTALARKRDFDGAIGEYREALRLNPNSPLAHTSLGNALINKGDLAGAMAECRQALNLNPNYTLAHENLGIALSQKGDLDGAIAEYREAVRIKAEDPRFHYGLACALFLKGDRASALDQLRQAFELQPDNHLYRIAYEKLLTPVYEVGGSVTLPTSIYKPEPAYSKEARKAKLQGTAVLWIVVDSQGNVSDVLVAKPLGLGLDEKAVEKVHTWKFKPATANGVPIPVTASVEVTFGLYHGKPPQP